MVTCGSCVSAGSADAVISSSRRNAHRERDGNLRDEPELSGFSSAHHGVALAGAGLAVRQHADVVALERVLQHLDTDVFVHAPLTRVLHTARLDHTHTHTHTGPVHVYTSRTMPPRVHTRSTDAASCYARTGVVCVLVRLYARCIQAESIEMSFRAGEDSQESK